MLVTTLLMKAPMSVSLDSDMSMLFANITARLIKGTAAEEEQ